MIGAREDDGADQVFDAPVVLGEVGGEVVEEFGVGGFFAEGAEVIDGGNDASAEEVVPDSVGHDSGGEGVL